MQELIRSVVVFIVYIAEYYVYGLGFARLCRRKVSPSFYLLSGMFVHALLFFVVIMPMKLLKVPVHIAAVVWLILWMVSLLLIIVKCRRELVKSLRAWFAEAISWKWGSIVFLVMTGIQIIFDELYGRILGGENATYYIGYVTSSLFSDHMGMVSSETGMPLSGFYMPYFLQTYLDHSTIVARLTGLHPLLEIRTVIPAVMILIGNLLMWQFVKWISKGDWQKALYGWLLYWIIYHMFISSVLLPSIYSYFRTFEGKNVFANICTPLIFMCFWKMYERVDDLYWLWVTVIVISGSFTYCMYTMVVVPFMIIMYAGMIFIRRKWKLFRNLCICMLPCILAIGYYVLANRGIIDLTFN